jgi:multidrug efflux pump subunit AcrB
MTLENFRDLGIAMIFAFFLVYVLLVAQFRSFSATALIMVTVPLALIGILFGFVFLDFFGIYLTATALIGFIALIGLVVKNGILFLEYYDYKIAEGLTREQALTEAGRIRLQPIVLTSLTAILANLTIVTDSVWSGLAWAIVFGLSVSTVLSLVIFPILYNLVAPKR